MPPRLEAAPRRRKPKRASTASPQARGTPTRTQVRSARAQQAGHVSQGKAVARTAYRQKPVAERQATVTALQREVKKNAPAIRAGRVRLTPEAHQILSVHRGRHRADVAEKKKYGELKRVSAAQKLASVSPNVRVGRPLDVSTKSKTNKMLVAGLGVTPGTFSSAKALKQGMQRTTPFEKAVGGLGSATKSSALFALEQLNRPTSALARAAIEDVKAVQAGKSPIGNRSYRAAAKGFMYEGGKVTSFSDVLKQAGVKNKIARALGGFALDVLLDPTTYLTLGVAVPGKVAARAAYEAARREGLSEAARVAAAHKAWDAAGAAGQRAGVRVGVRRVGLLRGPGVKVGKGGVKAVGAAPRVMESVPMGGRVTSKVLRASGGGVTGAGKWSSRAREGLRAVAPNVRPAGVHKVNWMLERQAAARARAGAREASRIGVDRYKAMQRQTKGWTDDEHRQAIFAIERGPAAIAALPEKLRSAATNYADEMAEIHAREVAAGAASPIPAGSRVGASAPVAPAGLARMSPKARRAHEKAVADFEDMPEGYFARRGAPEGEPGAILPGRGTSGRGGPGAVQASSSLKRKDPRRLELQGEEGLERYDLNLARSLGQRAEETGRKLSARDLHDRLAALGTRHTADEIDWDRVGAQNGKRLIIDTGRGFKSALDKRGNLDKALIDKARRDGHDVFEIDEATFKRVEDMAMPRGRTQRGGLHGTKPGENLYDKSTRVIKMLQTSVNPSYHTTNILGDTFNAMLAGVRPGDFARSGLLSPLAPVSSKLTGGRMVIGAKNRRSAESALRAVDQADRTASDAFGELKPHQQRAINWAKTHQETYHNGEKLTTYDLIREGVAAGAVRTGLTRAELHSEVRGGVAEVAQQGRIARGASRVGDDLQRLNDWREDLIRLTTYRTARKTMGPDEAASWVSRHHFDYSDLSPAEQQVFRRIVPFYTFMARNTPLQVRNLAGRPGVFATEEKARMETAKAGGQNPRFANALREFEQTGVPFITPGARTLTEYGPGRKDTGKTIRAPWAAYPKLPIMDIANVPLPTGVNETWQSAVSNIIGRSHPLARLSIETGLGFNAFTKSKQEHDIVPAPSWAAKLEGTNVGNALGVRKAQDPRTGKMVPFWNWQADSAARIIPAINRASSVGRTTKHGQPTSNATLAVNTIGPARWAQIDPRTVKINQNFERRDKLERQLDTLKKTNPKLKYADRNKDGSKSKVLKWHGVVAKTQDKINKIDYENYELSERVGAISPSGRKRPVPKVKKPKRGTSFGGFGGGGGQFGAG